MLDLFSQDVDPISGAVLRFALLSHFLIIVHVFYVPDLYTGSASEQVVYSLQLTNAKRKTKAVTKEFILKSKMLFSLWFKK